jgi:competence protein ComEA
MMKLSRYAAALVLSTFLAVPVMGQTTSQTPSPRPSQTTPPPSATAPGTSGTTQPQGGLVDINSASAAQLDQLPGVGKSRAQAIIANRPYKGKDDLVQRKILPQNVYDGIKDKIVARQQ